MGELGHAGDLFEELWHEHLDALGLGEVVASDEGVAGFEEGLFWVADHYLEIWVLC